MTILLVNFYLFFQNKKKIRNNTKLFLTIRLFYRHIRLQTETFQPRPQRILKNLIRFLFTRKDALGTRLETFFETFFWKAIKISERPKPWFMNAGFVLWKREIFGRAIFITITWRKREAMETSEITQRNHMRIWQPIKFQGILLFRSIQFLHEHAPFPFKTFTILRKCFGQLLKDIS